MQTADRRGSCLRVPGKVGRYGARLPSDPANKTKADVLNERVESITFVCCMMIAFFLCSLPFRGLQAGLQKWREVLGRMQRLADLQFRFWQVHGPEILEVVVAVCEDSRTYRTIM